jgi:hypothetical protein
MAEKICLNISNSARTYNKRGVSEASICIHAGQERSQTREAMAAGKCQRTEQVHSSNAAPSFLVANPIDGTCFVIGDKEGTVGHDENINRASPHRTAL